MSSMKLYGVIGKILCGCAGAIVGYIISGPVLATVRVFAGVIASHFFEQAIIKRANPRDKS